MCVRLVLMQVSLLDLHVHNIALFECLCSFHIVCMYIRTCITFVGWSC